MTTSWRTRLRWARRAVALVVVTGLWLVAFQQAASADNCGSFSDCFFTADGATWALLGTFISIALDFVPIVGNVKGVIEAITGRDLITGQELEPWERALGILGPLGKGAKVVVGIGTIATIATRADRIADAGGALGTARRGVPAGDALSGARRGQSMSEGTTRSWRGADPSDYLDNGAPVFRSDSGIAIGDDAATMINLERSSELSPNNFDIIVHGQMRGEQGEIVSLADQLITNPRQIVSAIERSGAYKGQPVRLVTCYGGCGPAQELADLLGTPVTGVSVRVRLSSVDGTLQPVDRFGQSLPNPQEYIEIFIPRTGT